jgi:hypothetical protein
MDKLRMINYSKRLEKTQNALKFMIPEHFLNWKRITMVNKSKTPFFPISPCKRYPLGIWKIGNAASVTGLWKNGRWSRSHFPKKPVPRSHC